MERVDEDEDEEDSKGMTCISKRIILCCSFGAIYFLCGAGGILCIISHVALVYTLWLSKVKPIDVNGILVDILRRFDRCRKWAPLVIASIHFISLYLVLATFALGLLSGAVSLATFILAAASAARAVATDAGGIPDRAEWQFLPGDFAEAQQIGGISFQEAKRDGGRRHCKWCEKYKPDRTHHCKACKRCTLKMDHHCPWLNNCVGLRNYRFFLLLLLYGIVTLIICVGATPTGLLSAWKQHWRVRVVLTWAFLCTFVDGCVLVVFFLFHCWLVTEGVSTIEFMEKSNGSGERNPYNNGALRNWYELGAHPLDWLLPIRAPDTEQGLDFERRGVDRFYSCEEPSEFFSTPLNKTPSRFVRAISRDFGAELGFI